MCDTFVLILHYQSEKNTLDCLNSLLGEDFEKKQYGVIIICNSKSGFLDGIRQKHNRLIVIENKHNTGFAGGVNIGLVRALEEKAVNMIVLNNDTVVAEDFVCRMVSFAKKETSAGLISPKIYFYPGNEFHKKRYKKGELGNVVWYAGGKIDWKNIYGYHFGVDQVDNGQFDVVGETDFATGCCMLVRKELIKKVGLLDEKYFLYYEDVDYSIRAKSSGFKVMYYPQAHIWHKNAVSSGKPGSLMHVYYQTRNRLYFGYKYASWRAKKALFLESINKMQKGGIVFTSVIDYYLGRMGEKKL